MDYLRAGYEMPACFVAGSDSTATIRWYRAPDSAKVFPHQHAFASLVWDGATDIVQGPGERHGVRKWSPTKGPNVDGQHFEGRPEWYRHGVPASVLLTPPPPTLCGGHITIKQGTINLGIALRPSSATRAGEIAVGVSLGTRSQTRAGEIAVGVSLGTRSQTRAGEIAAGVSLGSDTA